jgi:hypothetical protein
VLANHAVLSEPKNSGELDLRIDRFRWRVFGRNKAADVVTRVGGAL